MTAEHTDLGNSVRAEIAAILKRYQDCDLAGVKMSTIRKIDKLINPAPQGFEINTARCDATPYRIMEVEAVERMKERA